MHKFLSMAVALALCTSAATMPARSASTEMPACASGDPVVWENLSGSKVYHMQGDSYYGKTKKGTYACKSAADGAGFHASGSKSSMKTTATPEPSPTPSGKHKHKHKGSSASPAPSPDAT